MSALSEKPAAPRNWDAGIKTLHWLMALLIPLAWLLVELRDEHPLDAAAKAANGQLMFFHKSIGLLVVALVVVRLVWRATHPAPAAEKTPWEPFAALFSKAGHGLLYLLMVAVPLGGIATSLIGGRPLPFFGLFEIASPFLRDEHLGKLFGGMHELGGNLLIVVVVAHAAVGILHHVVLKDRTLLKMRPFARD